MTHAEPLRSGPRGLVPATLLAGLVGVAAVTGGGFASGSRVLVTAGLAAVLGLAAAVWPWLPRREDAWALALVGWGAVTAAANILAPLEAKETLTAWLVAWALWAAVRGMDARAREVAVVVLSATAGMLALGVAAEFVGYRLPRVGGILDNPNVAAGLLVPTAVAVVLGRDGRGGRWRLGLALCLGSGVALTGSRAALLATLATAVVMLPRGRVRLWAALAGGGLVVVAVGWRLAAAPDPLAWHRLAIWRAVLDLAAGHPLTGVGPGNLALAARAVRIPHPDLFGVHQRMIGNAESTPLALAVTTGLVGVGLLAGAGWCWLRSGRASALWSVARARGAVTAMACFAMFHDLTEVDVVLWWWAILLGLLDGPSGSAPQRWPRALRFGVGTALLWVVAWGLAQPAYARWLWSHRGPSSALAEQLLSTEPRFPLPARWSTEELLGQQRWTWETSARALAWAERAVEAEPGQARLWADLGRVHARTMRELGWSQASASAAREAYARVSELEPWLPWNWAERADLEHTLGDLLSAVSLARRAVAVEPRFVGGYLILARLELDLGRVDAARAAFAAALRVRASARGRQLTSYERELVAAPRWQVQLLTEALE